MKNSCQSCHALGIEGHPQRSRRHSAPATVRSRPGRGASQAGQAMQQHGADPRAPRPAGGAWPSSPTGPTASPAGEMPASPSRSVRRAWSATSSSRMWDWSTPKHYLHDAVSSDKRDPTVNANGQIYGSPEESTDIVPVLDPVTSHGRASSIRIAIPTTPSSTGLPRGRRPTGATRRSGTATPASTTR